MTSECGLADLVERHVLISSAQKTDYAFQLSVNCKTVESKNMDAYQLELNIAPGQGGQRMVICWLWECQTRQHFLCIGQHWRSSAPLSLCTPTDYVINTRCQGKDNVLQQVTVQTHLAQTATGPLTTKIGSLLCSHSCAGGLCTGSPHIGRGRPPLHSQDSHDRWMSSTAVQGIPGG